MDPTRLRQLAFELLREAQQGEPTIAELWTRFRREHQLTALTWRGYEYAWRAQWEPRFGNLRASELTPEHIHTWREQRSLEPTRTRAPLTTPGCRNSELRVLRSLLSWAAKAGAIGRNPIAGVELERETGTRETVLTAEQIAAVERHASREDWALFLVAITGGLRKNEVRCLRWEDLDLETGVVRVRSSSAKLGRFRLTVVGTRAIEALRALPQASPWVFPSPRSNGPIAPQTITWRWARLRKRAGLQGPDGDVWLHDTRRTWGTTSAQQLPLPDVLAMGGWRNASTLLQHYHRLTPGRLREIRAALDLASTPPKRPRAVRQPTEGSVVIRRKRS
jgi:integrase